MKVRNSIWLPLIGLLLLTLFLTYRRHQNPPSPSSQDASSTASHSPGDTNQSASGQGRLPDAEMDTNRVYLVRANQALATVNGVPIMLSDLVPVNATNSQAEHQLSPEAYEYFMNRAIDRELLMQTARAQGLTLTESEQHQLVSMRAGREESEPGLVQKLTVDSGQVDLELRDAQAFMLQNQLLAKVGAGADITPEQVEQYYREHVGQFGELPSDPEARKEAWQQIEFEIRQQQAPNVRKDFQKKLKVYMDQLRARASIQSTPPLSGIVSEQAPGIGR